MPALAQTSDGTIYLFWAYKPSTSTHSQIYYRTFKGNPGTWSAYTPVPLTVPTSMNDTAPSAAVGSDGSLWLVWTRDNSTVSNCCPIMRQLWYKTFRAGVWSPEASLTSASDINWNWLPSVMVGKDGVVRIVWSKGQGLLVNFQVDYMTFNATVWSKPVAITFPATQDVNPAIMQDRNGTIWVFWSRDVPVSSTLSDFVIYSRNSVDNGAHFYNQTETALTSIVCFTSSCVDSEWPAPVQSSTDRYLWLLFATDPSTSGLGFDIWELRTTNPIFPVHDVTLSSFTASSTLQYPGGFPGPYVGQSAIVTVFVTVRNLGDYNETVTVSLGATNITNYSLGNQNMRVLVGNSNTTGFNWNTTGVKPARYGLSANASIPKEPLGNRGDDSFAATNQIHILPLGDVDQDGSVTITDISVADFGYAATPPCSFSSVTNQCRWNPYADVNGDGIIDIVDIGVVGIHYGIFT